MADPISNILSAYPTGREGVRVKGNQIFIEGFDKPFTVEDENWKTLSNIEKSEIIQKLLDVVKPRQGARAVAQGASVGLSDEAIAAATNPKAALSAAIGGESESSQAYYDRLEKERQALDLYRQQYPAEAALAEISGAVGTGVLAGLATGGGSTATTGSQLARLGQTLKQGAKIGAIEGAAYGFGQAEGGIQDRLRGAGLGIVYGAGTGAVTSPIAAGVAITARAVINGAKKLFGGKGGAAVEAELQRLAEGTGLSTDEIVQKIADGEIMAENETLRMTVRSIMTKGGKAETAIKAALKEDPKNLLARPKIKREEAVAEIEAYLARNNDLAEKNPLVVEENFDAKIKAAETKDYEAIPNFKKGQVPLEVNFGIMEAIDDFPEIAKDLEKFILSRSKGEKIFTVKDTPDGKKYYMTRNLTLQEAEEARRYFRDTARDMQTGNAMKTRMNEYRFAIEEPLYEFSEPLKNAARNARSVRNAKDLYTFGTTIFNKSSDEVDILLRNFQDKPDMMRSLKAGALVAFRKKMEARGSTNFMNILSNPSNKEAKIFDLLFTKDELEKIMPKVEQAALSQTAANEIVRGPSTEPTRAASAQLGKQVTMGDVGQVLAAPIAPINAAGAAVNVAAKLVSQINPDLSPRQRERIASILLSEDPNVVEKALRDQRGMELFASAVDRLASAVTRGVRMPAQQQATTDERTSYPLGLLTP